MNGYIDKNNETFDTNEDYINLALNRLKEPFNGFDSIDEKMLRVPNDLNDKITRNEYVNNHIKWFLKNDKDAINKFLQEVDKKYSMVLFEN